MKPWHYGAGAAVLVALGVVAGVLLSHGTFASRDDAPKPPCPSGWFESHDGAACQPQDEVCHSYLEGSDSRAVSCSVHSPDGKGALRISLQGTGTVRVSVRDGRGATLYDQTFSMGVGLPPDVALSGGAGTWTLVSDYQNAEGSANVALWG